jgi:hypothetical protein
MSCGESRRFRGGLQKLNGRGSARGRLRTPRSKRW